MKEKLIEDEQQHQLEKQKSQIDEQQQQQQKCPKVEEALKFVEQQSTISSVQTNQSSIQETIASTSVVSSNFYNEIMDIDESHSAAFSDRPNINNEFLNFKV